LKARLPFREAATPLVCWALQTAAKAAQALLQVAQALGLSPIRTAWSSKLMILASSGRAMPVSSSSARGAGSTTAQEQVTAERLVDGQILQALAQTGIGFGEHNRAPVDSTLMDPGRPEKALASPRGMRIRADAHLCCGRRRRRWSRWFSNRLIWSCSDGFR